MHRNEWTPWSQQHAIHVLLHLMYSTRPSLFDVRNSCRATSKCTTVSLIRTNPIASRSRSRSRRLFCNQICMHSDIRDRFLSLSLSLSLSLRSLVLLNKNSRLIIPFPPTRHTGLDGPGRLEWDWTTLDWDQLEWEESQHWRRRTYAGRGLVDERGSRMVLEMNRLASQNSIYYRHSL